MGIFNLTLQASFARRVRVPGPAARDRRRAVVRAGGRRLPVHRGDHRLHRPAERAADPRPARIGARGRASGRSTSCAKACEVDPQRPRGQPADRPPGGRRVGRRGPRRAGSGACRDIGLQPTQLAVIVVPLGIGVVIGVVRAAPVRRPSAASTGRGERACRAWAADRVPRPCRRAGRRARGFGLSVLPFVVAAGAGAGAAYAVVSVSAQTALLESMPSRGSRPRVRCARVDRERGQPRADAHRGPARRPRVGVAGHRGRRVAVVGVGLWSARWPRSGRSRARPGHRAATAGARPVP